jgi:uncharacterized membrane protein YcaP (DUF421 family)
MNHFLRTLLMYAFVFLVIRLMGKREIGQLSPFDFVVAIMIAELAALPLEDTSITFSHALIPIATLAAIEIIFSFLSLKSTWLRSAINGSPSIVVRNGQILDGNLRNLRYNVNDLLAHLRQKDIADISEVEYAILECSGQISVVKKSQLRPVTPQDLNIETSYEGIPVPLIIDGEVLYGNLDKAQLTYQWLLGELAKLGLDHPRSVIYATLNSQGQFYASPRQDLKPEDLYTNL